VTPVPPPPRFLSQVTHASARPSLLALRLGGYTASEAREAGYSASVCQRAGYLPGEVASAGFPIDAVMMLGYSVAELSAAGVALPPGASAMYR
jgi:ribosomal protein L13E